MAGEGWGISPYPMKRLRPAQYRPQDPFGAGIASTRNMNISFIHSVTVHLHQHSKVEIDLRDAQSVRQIKPERTGEIA